MADTTDEVRRDIELTRTRISDTLEELEHKLNVAQLVRDNPWPALALAVGAGVVLSGTRADVKAAAATVAATRGASGRVTGVLDDLVSQVVQGIHGAFENRIDALAGEMKRVIGLPSPGGRATAGFSAAHDVVATSHAPSGGAPRAD
jgi:hypothetical protein